MKEWIATYNGRIKLVEAVTAVQAQKEGAVLFGIKDHNEVTVVLQGDVD